MIRVLLVDDDRGLHKLLGARLSKYKNQFEIVHADNGQKAKEILERTDISVLVTDIVMPKMDGLQLLSYMEEQHPDTPCIVITSYPLPMAKGKLLSKVFHYIQKPVSPPELAQAILRGLEQSKKAGDLGTFSVAGILQLVEIEGKTCLLDIHQSGERKGSLFIYGGQLYNAICGKLLGEDAALNLLVLDEVLIKRRTLPKKGIARLIHKSNQHLLLNAMHLKDTQTEHEAENKSQKSLKLLLHEGIRLCEKLEFDSARQSFLTILESDRKNFLCWLWFSRTLTDMKKLKMALVEAQKLNPNNPDMLEDIKKVRSLESVPYTEIVRCPFCYAPVDRQGSWCLYCKSNLLVNVSSFPMIDANTVQHSLVQQAFERFEKVLANELSTKLLFYVGAACLNLGMPNKALTYLNLLLSVIDEDSRYKKLAEQVVEFIASKQLPEKSKPPADKDKDEQTELSHEQQTTTGQNKKTILVENQVAKAKFVPRAVDSQAEATHLMSGKRKNRAWIFGVIFFLVCVGIGGYFFSSKKEIPAAVESDSTVSSQDPTEDTVSQVVPASVALVFEKESNVVADAEKEVGPIGLVLEENFDEKAYREERQNVAKAQLETGGIRTSDVSGSVEREEKVMAAGKIILRLEPGTVRLTVVAGSIFAEFVDFLLQYPDTRVLVKGFVASNNDSLLNTRLSLKRAASVRELLVKHGVAESNIEIRGMGIQDPIATNDTSAGRLKNRRVEIEVIIVKSI